jgi:hypothetical protein
MNTHAGARNFPGPEPYVPIYPSPTPAFVTCWSRGPCASATQRPPLPSLTIDRGEENWPLPLPADPKDRRQCPSVGSRTATRLWSVSATYTLPSDPIVRSRGRLSAPRQVPCVHSFVPLLSILKTRELYVSATYTPVASTAMPNGAFVNAVVPPKVCRGAPSVEISTIWLSVVSATHRDVPSVSTTRSRGLFHPAVLTMLCTPLELSFTIRSPPESAT